MSIASLAMGTPCAPAMANPNPNPNPTPTPYPNPNPNPDPTPNPTPDQERGADYRRFLFLSPDFIVDQKVRE